MDCIGEWSENFAKYTWDRLRFVYYNEQAKLQETTITDDLVFQITKQFPDTGTLLMLEHAKDEKRNGNDLEFAIAIEKGRFLIFPIQAKRMYAKQRYPRISYKGQLEGLIDYAKEVGGVPLYLLYNFVARGFNHSRTLCGRDLQVDHYGCALVAAEHIQSNYAYKLKRKNKMVWRIPTFLNLLNDGALIPWHVLFYDPRSLAPVYERHNQLRETSLRTYTKDELLNDKDWQRLTRISQTDAYSLPIERDFSESRLIEVESDSKFSPRFRFLIDPFDKGVGLNNQLTLI